MIQTLQHSPADIIRNLLVSVTPVTWVWGTPGGITWGITLQNWGTPVNSTVGTYPPTGGKQAAANSWPIYATGEPASPDNVITVYDTTAQDDGRSMVDGRKQQHYGIQVRVRTTDPKAGYAKAQALAAIMDQGVYDSELLVDDAFYEVSSICRVGEVLALGRDKPRSARTLFTINAVTTIRLLSVVTERWVWGVLPDYSLGIDSITWGTIHQDWGVYVN